MHRTKHMSDKVRESAVSKTNANAEPFDKLPELVPFPKTNVFDKEIQPKVFNKSFWVSVSWHIWSQSGIPRLLAFMVKQTTENLKIAIY